jgi:2-polyprenyl-3-methyl-5-hydroxy-6-metoxy-1,4-benzoquinol methylase
VDNMSICPFCGVEYKIQTYKHYYYCENCNIAFRDQRFISDAESRQSLSNTEWASKHSKDRDINIMADNLVSQIQKISNIGKVLDVGCGSGVLVDKLSKFGYQATGIDWSEQAIIYARNHMSGTFIIGDADLNTFRECKYDIIVASHILEHLENPRSFFEGVKEVLDDGGSIVLAVPNLWWYDRGSFLRRNPSSIFDEDHTVCYSPIGLMKMMQQYGFQDIQITTKTHSTMLLTILAVNVYQKLVRRKVTRAADGIDQGNRPLISIMFEKLSNNALTRLAEKPFNKLSERRYKGMELIAIGRSG